MEVEAQADGFLTDVRAAEGDEVPVGQVIALISDSPGETGGGDKASSSGDSAAASPDPKPAAAKPVAPPEPAAKATAQKPDPAPVGKPNGSTNGRVLASPKARRLAGEQGLDLRRLADAGHPQPYRAADIETLKAMGSAATAPSATAKAQANLPAAAYQRFLDLISAETDVPSGTVVAAFAAGALRATGGLGTRNGSGRHTAPCGPDLRRCRQGAAERPGSRGRCRRPGYDCVRSDRNTCHRGRPVGQHRPGGECGP